MERFEKYGANKNLKQNVDTTISSKDTKHYPIHKSSTPSTFNGNKSYVDFLSKKVECVTFIPDVDHL